MSRSPIKVFTKNFLLTVLTLSLVILSFGTVYGKDYGSSKGGNIGKGEEKQQKKVGKRERILVWRLERKQGVSEEEIDSISGYVAAEVERVSGRKVVSEGDINTVLKGEEKRQMCGSDAECVAEVGNALGVPIAVAGNIGRVGRFWFLNLSLINVRKVETIKRISKKIEGDINAVINELPEAISELFGVSTKERGKAERGAEYNLYGHIAFWSGLGLSALGGIALWQAIAKGEDYENGEREAKEASDAWSVVMISSFSAGAALMATGAVLWLLDDGTKEDKTGLRKVLVVPLAGEGFGGVIIKAQW